MSNVILKNVTKIYDKKKVIDNIDLTINDKEFIVLVGASGCGKSTLLRMIAGLEEITAGEIFIGDKKVNDVQPKDRDIAFVFQSYALYPHMTVRENIAFGLKMRKVDKAEIEKKVEEAAQILNLGEYLDRKPKQLSGGQRQRVALGRAIVRNPKVFLMIVVLDKGVIQQVASPEEIYNNPANTFVAGFIGSPQMNFINSDDFPYKTQDNVIIGIRPEKMFNPDGNIKFSVKVDITELLGSEKIAYFNIGENKCSAKLPSDFHTGENLELSISSDDLYFFDRKTGKRI